MPDICALEGCPNSYTRKVHNQRFCSRECCRVYTNKRILEQYHERKNRTMTGRTCRTKSCSTVLSRYNEDDFCGVHQQERFTKRLKQWGWYSDSEGGVRGGSAFT